MAIYQIYGIISDGFFGPFVSIALIIITMALVPSSKIQALLGLGILIMALVLLHSYSHGFQSFTKGKVVFWIHDLQSFMAIRTDGLWFPLTIILVGVSILIIQILTTRHYLRKKPQSPRLSVPMIILCFITGLTLCYYIVMILGDAGYITVPFTERKGSTATNMWSYCDRCSTYRPPKTIHCTECQVCVLQYDHHCGWINKCVGKQNIMLYWIFVNYIGLFLVSFIITIIITIRTRQ